MCDAPKHGGTVEVVRKLREIRKSAQDGKITGICGELGEYTPLPSWLWRVNKVLCVLTLLAALAGCASTGASLVGERAYAPLQATQPVLVFNRESEVKRVFEVIAMINHTDPGKFQILTLESAMPALKDKARAVGAN